MATRETRFVCGGPMLALAAALLSALPAAAQDCPQGDFPAAPTMEMWGRAVAMDAAGAYAMVGGPEQGGSYGKVRTFVNDGTWVESFSLTAGDPYQAGAFFGAAIAMAADGLTAAIAAPGDRHGGAFPEAGSVYIFVRAPGSNTWTQQVRLIQPSPAFQAHFGTSVALSDDGNTLVVGQVGNAFMGNPNDSAWVFTRSGTAWSPAVELVPAVNDEVEDLGRSAAVSADGTMAALGAPGAYFGNDGSTYVFAKTGGVWSQVERLTYAGATGGGFGGATAFAGSQLLVADALYDTDVSPNTGLVQVYAPAAGASDGPWTIVQTLHAPGFPVYSNFGGALSVRGDRAAIGSPTEVSNHGKVYQLQRVKGVWQFAAQLEPPASEIDPDGDNPMYGSAVAISADGNEFVVGAPLDTVNNVYGAGRAYFPDLVTEATTLDLLEGQCSFGFSVTLPNGEFVWLSFDVIGQILALLTKACPDDELPVAVEVTGLSLTPVQPKAVIPLGKRSSLTFTDMHVSLHAGGDALLPNQLGSATTGHLAVDFTAKLQIGSAKPVPVSWVVQVPPTTVKIQSSGGLQLVVPNTNGAITPDFGLGPKNPTGFYFGSGVAGHQPPPPCVADLDGDLDVGAADLGLLLGEWGQFGSFADLDQDGEVGAADLAILLGAWGTCPA